MEGTRRCQLLGILVSLLMTPVVHGLENGLARTPPMGWLSWERYGCNIDCVSFPHDCISESLYLEMGQKLVELGLADLGYQYVNIDDCWSKLSRDSKTGELFEDSVRFPSGLKSLSHSIHTLGLKFGLYTDVGTMTCGGYPGLAGHVESDIVKFAKEYEIDSLKVDGCYANVSEMSSLYSSLSATLNKTGRPILYSCSWPAYQENDHCENEHDMNVLKTNCNLWRNFVDISDSWGAVQYIASFFGRNSSENLMVKSAGPGHWNDPDMLLVGNPGLSISEQRAQFALWAILAAPLYISSDLRHIGAESLAILKNKEVIDINQDADGKQGYVLSNNGNSRIWIRHLSQMPGVDERVALVFENKGSIFGAIRFHFSANSQLGWNEKGCAYSVRDLHAHTDISTRVSCETPFVVDVDESSVEMFLFSRFIHDPSNAGMEMLSEMPEREETIVVVEFQ